MKSFFWVTLPLLAASALFGDQAFAQRTPESARAAMELLELRQSLAGIRSQLNDLSGKLAETRSFQRELAEEVKSSLADIRREVARARGAGPAAAPLQAPLFPGLFHPCPRFGAKGPREPDPDLIDALREQVRVLEDCFKRVQAEYETGRLSVADYRQLGCKLAIAKAELAWAEADLKAARTALNEALAQANHEIEAWRAREAEGLPVREGALDRRVSALKRRTAVLTALACVKAHRARQQAETPPKKEPKRKPKPDAASGDGAAAAQAEVIEALGQLVDGLGDCHKRVEAEFQSGQRSTQDFARIGYELNAAKAELAWAQGDRQAAARGLKEALERAETEIAAWMAAEAAGLPLRAGAWDRRIAAVHRRVEAVTAAARVRRSLAPQ